MVNDVECQSVAVLQQAVGFRCCPVLCMSEFLRSDWFKVVRIDPGVFRLVCLRIVYNLGALCNAEIAGKPSSTSQSRPVNFCPEVNTSQSLKASSLALCFHFLPAIVKGTKSTKSYPFFPPSRHQLRSPLRVSSDAPFSISSSVVSGVFSGSAMVY
ncbi:hypothetical protein VTK26DRAFT_5088 [Humicola hyalothermophila]